MSHLTTATMALKDKQALIAALTAMGLKPQLFDQPILLTNARYRSDRAKIPVHILVSRADFGHDLGVDIGFRQTDNEFLIVADDYDLDQAWWSRWKDTHPDEPYRSFKQELFLQYAVALTQQKFPNARCTIEVDGEQLEITAELPSEQLEMSIR